MQTFYNGNAKVLTNLQNASFDVISFYNTQTDNDVILFNSTHDANVLNKNNGSLEPLNSFNFGEYFLKGVYDGIRGLLIYGGYGYSPYWWDGKSYFKASNNSYLFGTGIFNGDTCYLSCAYSTSDCFITVLNYPSLEVIGRLYNTPNFLAIDGRMLNDGTFVMWNQPSDLSVIKHLSNSGVISSVVFRGSQRYSLVKNNLLFYIDNITLTMKYIFIDKITLGSFDTGIKCSTSSNLFCIVNNFLITFRSNINSIFFENVYDISNIFNPIKYLVNDTSNLSPISNNGVSYIVSDSNKNKFYFICSSYLYSMEVGDKPIDNSTQQSHIGNSQQYNLSNFARPISILGKYKS